jgi:glycosyltransferase involved in cell wall biosynthesis
MSATDPWQILQFSEALDLELAAALADSVPVVLWEPDRSLLPIRPGFRESSRGHAGSSLEIRTFPLQRGFARLPEVLLTRIGSRIAARLAAHSPRPGQSPLICTIPWFAAVAEAWPGPVVYWLTDLIAEYENARREGVLRLDRRLCAAATLVCPNSERIAQYLTCEAGCDPKKIHVLPNAARAANLLKEPPASPGPLPADLSHLRRPVAGIIGNLAGNTDWLLLEKLLPLVPEFCWVFIGPVHDRIADRDQGRARAAVMANPRSCFAGPRPYADLVHYARALDVAILPYLRREPTWSGSSTRFYEHLAACRPMIAFAGVHELYAKIPLLELAATAEEAATLLERLRACEFDDGLAGRRFKASRSETWQTRAVAMQQALSLRQTCCKRGLAVQ